MFYAGFTRFWRLVEYFDRFGAFWKFGNDFGPILGLFATFGKQIWKEKFGPILDNFGSCKRSGAEFPSLLATLLKIWKEFRPILALLVLVKDLGPKFEPFSCFVEDLERVSADFWQFWSFCRLGRFVILAVFRAISGYIGSF